MTPALPLTAFHPGLRFLAWLVVAVAATFFCFHGVQQDFAIAYGVTYAISLALAWALGLMGAGSLWPIRILVVVITAGLPLIMLFVILMIGCPLMNTFAHGYRCGL